MQQTSDPADADLPFNIAVDTMSSRILSSPRPANIRSTAPLPRRLATAIAAVLALAATAAHAQDEIPADIPLQIDADAAPLDSAVVDEAVYATLLPCSNVVPRALVDSAIASVLVPQVDPRRKPIVPASAPRLASSAPRPIHVDGSPVIESPATLQVGGQLVMVRADGMPAPNAPSTDPFVRVLPRAVNPSDVQVGAHWGAQDRIPAPLLSGIAWNAQADLFAGPLPTPRGTVRRSLRITAQWDNPEDLTIGFTPGVEHATGGLFQHHVTGLQASTVDTTQAARWHSFIEVSGEKLAPGNLIENATAQVNAGATYSASNSTQLDVSVSRGTTQLPDLRSSIGLQVHF